MEAGVEWKHHARRSRSRHRRLHRKPAQGNMNRKQYNEKYPPCCHGVPAYDDCAKCDKLTAEDKAEKETIRRDPELREAAKQMRRIGKAIQKESK